MQGILLFLCHPPPQLSLFQRNPLSQFVFFWPFLLVSSVSWTRLKYSSKVKNWTKEKTETRTGNKSGSLAGGSTATHVKLRPAIITNEAPNCKNKQTSLFIYNQTRHVNKALINYQGVVSINGTYKQTYTRTKKYSNVKYSKQKYLKCNMDDIPYIMKFSVLPFAWIK